MVPVGGTHRGLVGHLCEGRKVSFAEGFKGLSVDLVHFNEVSHLLPMRHLSW